MLQFGFYIPFLNKHWIIQSLPIGEKEKKFFIPGNLYKEVRSAPSVGNIVAMAISVF